MNSNLTEIEKETKILKEDLRNLNKELLVLNHELLRKSIDALKKNTATFIEYGCLDIYEVKIIKNLKYKIVALVISTDYKQHEPYEKDLLKEYIRVIY